MEDMFGEDLDIIVLKWNMKDFVCVFLKIFCVVIGVLGIEIGGKLWVMDFLLFLNV